MFKKHFLLTIFSFFPLKNSFCKKILILNSSSMLLFLLYLINAALESSYKNVVF